MRPRVPLVYHALLWCPGRIQERLQKLEQAGAIDRAPSLYQVWMGVLYMWARVVLRPDSIGLSDDEPVRTTPGAKRLQNRLFRGPAVFRARAVNPLDQVGLGSSTPHIIRHLIGAYHPGDNALYDLQILDVEPGAIEALRERVAAVVDGTDPDSELLRDLCVYEGYHERLLEMVDRWIALGPDGAHITHPDTTLRAFMAWCASAPPSPAATWRAMRSGSFSLLPQDA